MTLDQFVTPNFRAERLTAAHRPEIRQVQTDPEVMAMLGGVRSEEATDAYLERNLAHWEQFGHGIYLLRERDNDTLVGLACLRHLPLDGEDEIEIGYSFFPAYWGRGFGTEVARACLDLGFRELQVPSLVAVTHPENLGSRRVMEKAGMAYERDVDLDGHTVVLYRARRPAAP